MLGGNNGFDLNSLMIFKHVVELSSMSKAAEKLGINASTVTRKLTELETFYGVKLLIRTTRTLTLTQEGKTFYESCLNVEDILRCSEGEITHNQTEPTGILKIVSPVDFGNLVLMDPLCEFGKKYPKVDLEIEFSNRQVDVIEEGVDIWLSVGETLATHLIAKRLININRGLMASPSYLQKYGTIASISDINPPHKQIKNTSPFSYLYSNILSDLPAQVSVNSTYAVLKACMAGLGLAFISKPLADKYTKDGELVRLLEDKLDYSVTIQMLYAERNLKPLRTQVFLDFIANYFTNK